MGHVPVGLWLVDVLLELDELDELESDGLTPLLLVEVICVELLEIEVVDDFVGDETEVNFADEELFELDVGFCAELVDDDTLLDVETDFSVELEEGSDDRGFGELVVFSVEDDFSDVPDSERDDDLEEAELFDVIDVVWELEGARFVEKLEIPFVVVEVLDNAELDVVFLVW